MKFTHGFCIVDVLRIIKLIKHVNAKARSCGDQVYNIAKRKERISKKSISAQLSFAL